MADIVLDRFLFNSNEANNKISDFIENPYLAQKYGMKEIQRAKEFFFNNKIHILMHHRIDK